MSVADSLTQMCCLVSGMIAKAGEVRNRRARGDKELSWCLLAIDYALVYFLVVVAAVATRQISVADAQRWTLSKG